MNAPMRTVAKQAVGEYVTIYAAGGTFYGLLTKVADDGEALRLDYTDDVGRKVFASIDILRIQAIVRYEPGQAPGS
jgi:hypothetical protein